MPDTVARTIHLKAINYRAGRRRDFEPQPIDDLIAEVYDQTAQILDRLYPDVPEDADDQRRRFFFNPPRRYKEGLAFQYCTYVPGATPLQMVPDLEADEVELVPHETVDQETGEKTEVVTACHVLAKGGVLLVDVPRGGGGVGGLARYLTYLLRTFIDDNMPSIGLRNVPNHSLLRMIESGGGVREVYMDLTNLRPSENDTYSQLLDPVRKRIGRTESLRVSWKTGMGGGLDPNTVEKAFYAQRDEEPIENVVLSLANGEVVKLEEHKVRKPVEVNGDGSRNPDSQAMINQMRRFMLELQEINHGLRIIDNDGNLVPFDE